MRESDCNKITLVKVPKRINRNDLIRRKPTGGRFVDLSGREFDRLTVIGLAGYLRHHSTWLCRCECGRRVLRRGIHLQNRSVSMCRACSAVRASDAARTHGLSRSPAYGRWWRLSRRGRLCKRWQDDLAAFSAAIGAPPSSGHMIEAIDATKPIGPRNWQWQVVQRIQKRVPSSKAFTAS
jgi:hypothetical protein